MRVLIKRVKNKVWSRVVIKYHTKWLYKFLYSSFWHFLLYNTFKTKKQHINILQYLSTYPNYGAGFGHQMANWISGYWWAKRFGLNYVHIPFPNQSWENFLGFGEDEIKINELINQGYRKVLLPMFDENSQEDINRIQGIISSYKGKNVVFIAEQDQGFKNHYEVMDNLKQKFYSASSRKNDKLLYTNDFFNIAIHVRRGDIVVAENNKNLNLKMRWQNNSYFFNVLQQVTATISTNKPFKIYLFSQGERSHFNDFEVFENICFCLDTPVQESFLHMVYADLLITSKSSFSYKPALISNGIKICPADFWHGYPERQDWIIADENGQFDKLSLLKNFE